jgi:hypothetical protein
MKKCKKCGNSFFAGSLVSDYCRTCEEQYPELALQQKQEKEQKRIENVIEYGKLRFPQLCEGKETVVLLVEGDTNLQIAVECANGLGYELMNTSSSMSMWTPFTKYTLIFKKKTKSSEAKG